MCGGTEFPLEIQSPGVGAEELYWIPEIDNGCRMWKCPKCGKRMGGQPLGWYQFNYYRFCPYCGVPLRTKARLVDKGGLPEE